MVFIFCFIVCISFFKFTTKKGVREKSRECHNHKPQPFPHTKRKRKQTKLSKRKSNKRTKSTKTSSLLLYVFPCVILFLCFSVLLVLRLPRLGKRELILVLFVRLFGLCSFRFVGFLFLLGSGKGCGCDCGTPWTFLLPFVQ